jgi:hypothetical protein
MLHAVGTPDFQVMEWAKQGLQLENGSSSQNNDPAFAALNDLFEKGLDAGIRISAIS